MLLFGFEVDTLEIQLREVHDMVDVVFIVEATVTHKGARKPLMWERLQFEKRFHFLESGKVVHVIAASLGYGGAPGQSGGAPGQPGGAPGQPGGALHCRDNTPACTEWWFEDGQTAAGVEEARAWAAAVPGRLGQGDLFVSANIDEVLSRAALQSLAHCSLAPGGDISGALWMPVGNLALALRTDFPVQGRPHTFGLPSIYRWEDIESGRREGRRLQSGYQGVRDRYVLGGIHMTNAGFLPNAILKEITGTEYKRNIADFFNDKFTLEILDKQQSWMHSLGSKPFWRNYTDPIESVDDVSPYLPWFLACNPDRFPYWWGRPDPRNRQLVQAMHSKPGQSEDDQ